MALTCQEKFITRYRVMLCVVSKGNKGKIFVMITIKLEGPPPQLPLFFHLAGALPFDEWDNLRRDRLFWCILGLYFQYFIRLKLLSIFHKTQPICNQIPLFAGF